MGAGRCGRSRAGLYSLGTAGVGQSRCGDIRGGPGVQAAERPAGAAIVPLAWAKHRTMFARAACVDGILVLSGAVQSAAWTV